MSYDLKRSHFGLILEKLVSTGEEITEEGQALVAVLDATTGEETVQVSAGAAATEVFVGWSIRDNASNSTTSVVEELTIPAATPFTLTLANNNIVSGDGTGSTAQLYATADGTDLTNVDEGAAGNEEIAINPATGVVTFNTLQAGQALVVQYRYNLTVAEARLKFFQRNINNEASTLFSQVGVGMGHGEIFTDQFDATIDWSAAGMDVETGAGGIVTNGGTGAVIDARVISVPNVNNPLLGLAFNTGGALAGG
jgi:hypothetical protein